MGDEQRLSERGVRLLISFEGSVNHIYRDQAGLETIGVGHLLTAAEKASGEFIHGITPERSRELLKQDVRYAEEAVNKYVKVPLTVFQFDVLVSFTFNLGAGALSKSGLLLRLNAGDYEAVPGELEKWCKRKDPKTGLLVVDQGLLGRRRSEGKVWMNGYDHAETNAAIQEAALRVVTSQLDAIDAARDLSDDLRKADLARRNEAEGFGAEPDTSVEGRKPV